MELNVATLGEVGEAERSRVLGRAEGLFRLRFQGPGRRSAQGYAFRLASEAPLAPLAEKYLEARWGPAAVSVEMPGEPELAGLLGLSGGWWREVLELKLGLELVVDEEDGRVEVRGEELDVVLAISTLSELSQAFRSPSTAPTQPELRREFMKLLMESPLEWKAYNSYSSSVIVILAQLLRDTLTALRLHGETVPDQDVLHRLGGAPKRPSSGPTPPVPGLRPPPTAASAPQLCPDRSETVRVTQQQDRKRALQPSFSGDFGQDSASQVELVSLDDVEMAETERKRASPDLSARDMDSQPSTSLAAEERRASQPSGSSGPPPTEAQRPAETPRTTLLRKKKPETMEPLAGWRVDAVLEMLRPIVVDAMNVGMKHGKNNFVSVRGILLVMKALVEQGHKVLAIMPECYRPQQRDQAAEHCRTKYPVADREALEWLHQSVEPDLLVFTPGGVFNPNGGKRIVKFQNYDDLEIVKKAKERAALIVSQDQYLDVWRDYPEYKDVCTKSRICPIFEGREGVSWPTDGPLGRHGPSLGKALVLLPQEAGWTQAFHNHQLDKVEQGRALYVLHVLLTAVRLESAGGRDGERAYHEYRPWSAERQAWVRRCLQGQLTCPSPPTQPRLPHPKSLPAMAAQRPPQRAASSQRPAEKRSQSQSRGAGWSGRAAEETSSRAGLSEPRAGPSQAQAASPSTELSQALTEMGFELGDVRSVIQQNPRLPLDELVTILVG